MPCVRATDFFIFAARYIIEEKSNTCIIVDTRFIVFNDVELCRVNPFSAGIVGRDESRLLYDGLHFNCVLPVNYFIAYLFRGFAIGLSWVSSA